MDEVDTARIARSRPASGRPRWRFASDAPLPVPGAPLLHPIPLGAIALLLLNDHYLKQAHSSFLTGKLSDVAGMVFFPLFLLSLWTLIARAFAGWRSPGRRAPASRERAPERALAVCVVLTAGVFAWVNTTELGAASYRVGLGLLQWPFFALSDLLAGERPSGLARVAFTRDPSDLLALPALVLPYWLERRRLRGEPRHEHTAPARRDAVAG